MRYLLVDHITEIDEGKRIKGTKNVAMSEDFLEFHFPRNPIMPGVLQLEALAQLAGWLVAHGSDFKKWALVSEVKKSNFYRFAVPGDQVELEVEALGEGDDGKLLFKGLCKSGGKKLVRAEFSAEPVALSEIEEVEAKRHDFSVLRREYGF